VSSFLVSGSDESGKAFKARAVDLYHVKDGKISRKDSYWKNVNE
jgi:ketosteroid isomerase-like protein